MNCKDRGRCASLLLVAVLCGLCGCAASADVAEKHTVTLVTKSTHTEFWLSVFAGAEAAATEYNLTLNIMGPETEEDYEGQNQMIAKAVQEGTEAIVFSAIDYEKNAEAIEAAADAGIQIVSIDSGVRSDQISTYIGTDNYAAGRMAARAALERTAGPLRVGVVNYDEGTANGQERQRGAADVLLESGRAQVVAVVNTLVEEGQAQKDTTALLKDHPEINVLIAFNEPTSVGAARAIEELDREEKLFFVGFDSNVATIDALQSGVVDALVVQNPYAMGYLGVESAYKLLTGKGASLEPTVDTATQIVDRSNIYSDDSQKVLFAFERYKD